MNDTNNLLQQLNDAFNEIERLKVENQYLRTQSKELLDENRRLRQMLNLPTDRNLDDDHVGQAHNNSPSKNNSLSIGAKVELFRNLFRGREDVYAVRWEGRDGGQWAFLKDIKKITPEEVENLIGTFTDSLREMSDKNADWRQRADPWNLPHPRLDNSWIEDLPSSVRIVLSNLIYIEKKGLPPAVVTKLRGLASFSNPEFYRAQKQRLSTHDKPRIIDCSGDFLLHVGLPRGSLEEVQKFFNDFDVKVELLDERNSGIDIDVHFLGDLSPQQRVAFLAIKRHENGVLSASTAFGKTVVAINLIAERKVNTLILVHRSRLMDQWKERLAVFLRIPLSSIGEVGGGKNERNGKIDIAMLQSLVNQSEVKDFVGDYGQVIVDECHHISAYSFEQILKKVRAKYVLGLTATPVRKDGHHPIVFMQCGPIRYRDNPRKQAAERSFGI